MNKKLENSLDRAILLLKTPKNYDDYISIKIQPINGGCCCFHCWPETWDKVNEHISPYGPLEDEGVVLLTQGDAKYVLECHESGPEIIVLAAASLALIKPIIELITVLLKGAQKESRKCVTKMKITKRYFTKGQVKEEEIMEISSPLTDKAIETLTANIIKTLRKRKK